MAQKRSGFLRTINLLHSLYPSEIRILKLNQRRQRVNHVEQTASAEETQDYENAATAALSAIDDDSVSFDGNDLVNFLEEGLACPSLSEGWRGKL